MAGQLEHQILTHALNRNTYGDVRGAVLENLMQRGKFKFNAIFVCPHCSLFLLDDIQTKMTVTIQSWKSSHAKTQIL